LKRFIASSDTFDNAPTVSWLLQNRTAQTEKTTPTAGHTPTSLYRMYGYLVVGFTIGLRTEVEFFFNQPSWVVAVIPDPRDLDPDRYAILSVLPYYLVKAFNRLVEHGLPWEVQR
ncbi:hypothetical protein K449DRAFT_449406, partial [Hypoxylon sp. EC38]